MARYTGPSCRQCRREMKKLYLKGERCYTPKCAVARKAYPPGERSGGRRRGKVSTYGLQLRAKEQVKRTYGVFEKQFRRFFVEADRLKGVTGTNLLQLMERRLDNLVYRLGFAASRKSARALINQGHVLVDGRPVDIPSRLISEGQVIAVQPKSLENGQVTAALEYADTVGRLEWISWDAEKKQGGIASIPDRDQIPIDVTEQLIVELYKK